MANFHKTVRESAIMAGLSNSIFNHRPKINMREFLLMDLQKLGQNVNKSPSISHTEILSYNLSFIYK
jgi:hypothetical protein